MEFSEEFALVQGSLISVQRTIGDLQFLSSKEGDDTKINDVVDSIHKVIVGRGIQPGNELDTKKDQSLRRIHMFLLLNTNLSVQERLMDDISCGHIVDCAPNLSKDLFMELVWRLSLHKYVCETIVYCPLSLGIELLDTILGKISSMDLLQALPRVEELCRAIFSKYVRQANKCSQRKLFTYFKTLLHYFVKPNLREMGHVSSQELYRLAGFAMKCILSLMTNCLKLYINPLEQDIDILDFYDISLPEYDEKETEMITSNNFINELLFACKVNFTEITVDVWLFWAECNIDEAVNTRTLQNEISEAMYCCSEDLKKAQNDNIPLAGEFISMLSSMAVKPRDEDDEIREADVGLIIKNVSDKSKSQKKWFKALLGLNEVMSDTKCAECLKNNLHLAEYKDINIILEKTVAVLDSQLSDEDCDKIRHIGLDSVKHLSLECQVEIVQWLFKTFGTSVNFLTESFHLAATEAFNKAVNMTEKKDKFLSEFVSLYMQSPVEVITRVLNEGLTNSKQISLMVEVLECLNPICNVCDVYGMDAMSGNKKMTFVTCLLNNVMKNDLTDLERSNFVNLVLALENHNIINGSVFLKRCLLPALYDSLSVRSWSLLLLWLEVLHSFIDGTVKSHTDIPACPLLVMLAQVLEASRWNLLTFSAGAVLVCEEALVIVRRVITTFLGTKLIEDMEVKWLQNKLDEFLSPLNKSYFSKLWSKFGREWASGPYNISIFFLDVMQIDGARDETNRKATELFQCVENKEHLITFSLSKLLPLCTATEWKILAQRIKEMSMFSNKTDSPVQEINLFADSVLLLIFVIKREGLQEDECVLSCLDYSIRNLGLVLKEEVIPQLKCLPTEEQVKVLIKMLHVLGRLPSSIKDACAVLMINVLVELLPDMLNDSVHGKENRTDSVVTTSFIGDIATNIGVLGNGEPLQLLARKLLECLVINDDY